MADPRQTPYGADFYKLHPLSCAPDDYWGQVRRTVNGVPIAEEQIDRIVVAVRDGLDLSDADELLDLCCGNGALTVRIGQGLRTLHGVDFSPPLVEVAQRDFAKPGQITFEEADVLAWLGEVTARPSFTKAVCYGSASFLSSSALADLMALVGRRFPTVERLYLGNLADLDRAPDFFASIERPLPTTTVLRDPDTQVGIWYPPAEITAMGEAAGWRVSIVRLGEGFFGHPIRYDAVLVRP